MLIGYYLIVSKTHSFVLHLLYQRRIACHFGNALFYSDLLFLCVVEKCGKVWTFVWVVCVFLLYVGWFYGSLCKGRSFVCEDTSFAKQIANF